MRPPRCIPPTPLPAPCPSAPGPAAPYQGRAGSRGAARPEPRGEPSPRGVRVSVFQGKSAVIPRVGARLPPPPPPAGLRARKRFAACAPKKTPCAPKNAFPWGAEGSCLARGVLLRAGGWRAEEGPSPPPSWFKVTRTRFSLLRGCPDIFKIHQ